ncbi:MmgE/PrpD family protein [Aeromicrobium yanjiei]|uniref:MmgE/PrpD family protein n=2 Tax=Aeromicrobium yanjiei TaxID=2662028 RepID=A0A5Q2MAB2_9ACTN|nr:MmgE/PrpD family protein [Aeromicrobium yanjiei]
MDDRRRLDGDPAQHDRAVGLRPSFRPACRSCGQVSDVQMNLTAQLADWAAAQADRPLDAAARHHVRRLWVDYLAAVIPGSSAPTSRQVAAHAAIQYPGDQAEAVGTGRLSALGAALVNGTSAHCLEVDDGYTPGSVHPSTVIFPAVLAAAQAAGSDDEITERALAVGLEVVCRLAAAGHPATWRNHFHNTPVTGVLGSAVAVAVLHRLDAEQIEHALGIAASHAGGLFAFLGQAAEVKRLHPGKAARDGIASAELAAAGVTGPRGVLEAPHGYIDAFARGDFDNETLVGDLGEKWAFLDTYVKPYPCCRHLHGPIDAVRALKAEHQVKAGDVESVTVRTYTVASHHAARTVDEFLDAQMSIPFAVTVALAFDEVGLTEFGDDVRHDATIRALVDRVSVVADADIDAVYPRLRPAIVEITLRDGSVLTHRVDTPYGEPSNPVSDEDMTGKLVRLAGPIIGSDRAAALAEQTWTAPTHRTTLDVALSTSETPGSE